MALVKIKCPACKTEHEVDESDFGKIAECSSCGAEFILAKRFKKTEAKLLSIDLAKDIWGKNIDSDFEPGNSIRPDTGKIKSNFVPNIELRPFIISHDAENPEEGSSYILLKTLGQGGMGVIYRARQACTDRQVALKLIRPEKRNDKEKELSFLTEAVVTANLEHPNIMPVYDVGYDQHGNPFYSMKEITGKNWQSLIKEKTKKENLQILLDVCDAVAYSHDQGVIHRDLKPDNVMIGEYGEIMLVDWGLAAAFGKTENPKAEPLHDESNYGGTAAYMAPEMAACDTPRIGPASDIYLLGGILYYIETGLVPHDSDDVFATIYEAMANKIQPAGIEGELTDIALEAMSTKIEDRFSSVKGFKNAVSGYLTHSESISLQESAEATLKEAEEKGDYELYAQSIFAFKEAVRQWPDNREAKGGVEAATLAYATCALKKDDIKLVQSLLKEDKSKHDKLLKQANKEQIQRIRRRRNIKILGVASIVLLISLLGFMVFAFLWVRDEKSKAVRAKNDAVKLRNIAEKAERKARNKEELTRQLLFKVEYERDGKQQALDLFEAEKKKSALAENEIESVKRHLMEEKNRLAKLRGP